MLTPLSFKLPEGDRVETTRQGDMIIHNDIQKGQDPGMGGINTPLVTRGWKLCLNRSGLT